MVGSLSVIIKALSIERVDQLAEGTTSAHLKISTGSCLCGALTGYLLSSFLSFTFHPRRPSAVF